MASVITETVDIMVDTTETPTITAVAVSETQTVAIRTTREIRITKAAVGSETQTALKTEEPILVDSEIQGIQTAEDPNHQVVDSEIVQAATKAQVQKDNRAAAALDKEL